MARHEKRSSAGRFTKAADGDPIFSQMRSRRPSPGVTLGVAGSQVFGGHIQEHEKSAELVGVTKYRTYSDILANVSIAAASVRYFMGLLTSPGWELEPKEEARGEELAELTDNILRDMTTPWHRVVRRAAGFRLYGFSVQEWTTKIREDGSVGFLDIEPRPQKTVDRWDVDDSGTVLGVVQRAPQTGEDIYLPRAKLVYLVDDTLDDSPAGLGLFRHLADPAKRLKRLEQLQITGFETDLHGTPVGRAPLAELAQAVAGGEITEAEFRAQVEGIESLLRNYVKTPTRSLLLDSKPYESIGDDKQTPSTTPQWDFQILETQHTGLDAILSAIQGVTQEIAGILGTKGLLLGDSGAGSLALSKDKSEQLNLLVEGTLLEIRETFQSDIVEPLFEMNGWPLELAPTLKTEPVQQRDAAEIAQGVADLAQAGAVVDRRDPLVNVLLSRWDLPPLDESIEIIDAALPGNAPESESPNDRDSDPNTSDDLDDAE